MTSHLPEPHYRLRCTGCGRIHRDDDLSMLLSCDAHHPPAVLRSEYRRACFRPIEARPGLFRYADWLPVRLHHPGSPRPAAFNAERLAAALGIRELVAVFSGYWPERGARMETCSFKELEALAVTARSAGWADRTLVVASAGNTARVSAHLLAAAPSDLQSIPERVARLAERRAA